MRWRVSRTGVKTVVLLKSADADGPRPQTGCPSLKLLLGSGLAGVLAPALKPVLWLVFFATLAWVLFCATTFLRAGHNFIRDGKMPPGRFVVVLLRFVAGQLAMLLRSLMLHVGKALSRPKPIVFDRTPKKGS